jgi:hypothetical protein
MMAASLRALPAELLLKVMESEATFDDAWCTYNRLPNEQKRMFVALRSSCVELNAKLLHFFGIKYYKTLRIPLAETWLSRLQTLSIGRLRAHVQTITVDATPLFE